MRSLVVALAVAAMTIGSAIFGLVNKTGGVMLLFGGAAIWLVAQKETMAVIERAIAAKTWRQAIDERSARRQLVVEQFHGLLLAEQEAVRHIKQSGHILAGQVVIYLTARGFSETAGVVDSVYSKTPFLIKSFAGEFSINPELKEYLDELLHPPLLSPIARAISLFLLVAVVLIAGYMFRKYAYPPEAAPAPNSLPANPTSGVEPQDAQQRGNSLGDSWKIDDSVSTEVRRKKPTIEFNFAANGDTKQKVHIHDVRPNLIQIEPKPTGVKEDDLPMDVDVAVGRITVLQFGQEDGGG